MYITKPARKSKNGKTYETILLRESYREGRRVKNRTLANLTHCKPQEIAALELALQYKNDLTTLASLNESVRLQQGPSVGSVYAVYQVAKRLGIAPALGNSFSGKLALWQVIARVLEQGSRLSAVRLAQTHAAGDVLGITRGFDEETLYANLKWLSQQQDTIERRLFQDRYGKQVPNLFLYDVTSSYLEGQCNKLAAYGYNRDGKKGKKQIVVGLLCDESGVPVSVEVFSGNTQDTQTFYSQIRKASKKFHCERVTFVGDRGMIKTTAIEELTQAGFHYITAITKPQIETLVHEGLIQMELFDENLCEVEREGVRYVLRRNSRRAEEIAATREDKRRSIEAVVRKQNRYLREHPQARAETARRNLQEKIERLRVDSWLSVEAVDRELVVRMDASSLERISRLDGCYVIKTDLPKAIADPQTIHDRYKDLAMVEWAFRTCKTAHLEIRPVFVRTEESTRAHVLVVMLAYMIVQELRRAWQALDVTVEEGLRRLSNVCSIEVVVKDQASCHKIPEPCEASQKLLKALEVRLPTALPHRTVKVVTKRKLPSRRLSS